MTPLGDHHAIQRRRRARRLAILVAVSVMCLAVFQLRVVSVHARPCGLWATYDARSWYAPQPATKVVGFGLVVSQSEDQLEYLDLSGERIQFDPTEC